MCNVLIKGRGLIFLIIGNKLRMSKKKAVPRWLSSKWLGNGFLMFFMIFFLNMIYVPVLVAKDI